MSLRAKRGPETVSLLVRDGDCILLVRRDRSANLFPLTWTLPGGDVLPGETAESAARRITVELFATPPAKLDILRKFPQPSPFTDERGPDTVVRIEISAAGAAALAGSRWTYPAELTGLTIFRECRDALLQLLRRQPVRTA
jgi:NUDIX domain